jgi:hypothetical protein
MRMRLNVPALPIMACSLVVIVGLIFSLAIASPISIPLLVNNHALLCEDSAVITFCVNNPLQYYCNPDGLLDSFGTKGSQGCEGESSQHDAPLRAATRKRSSRTTMRTPGHLLTQILPTPSRVRFRNLVLTLKMLQISANATP